MGVTPAPSAASSVARNAARPCEATFDARMHISRVRASSPPCPSTSPSAKLSKISNNSGSFAPSTGIPSEKTGREAVAASYCASSTGSSHVFTLVAGLHSTARWENQLSGAAPCQCTTSGAISTTSPGSSSRAGPFPDSSPVRRRRSEADRPYGCASCCGIRARR